MNWCLNGVHDGETHPTPILFHSENSFQLSEYINVLEQQVLACKKSVFTHEILSNEFKVCVQCATSGTTFIKPIFITTNSHRCVMHILTPLFKHLSNYKNTYAFSSKTVQAMLCCSNSILTIQYKQGIVSLFATSEPKFKFNLQGMVRDQD